jgi:hypothetical protein
LPGQRPTTWRPFTLRANGIRASFDVAMPPAMRRLLRRCGRVEVVSVMRTTDGAGARRVMRSRDVLSGSVQKPAPGCPATPAR